MFTWKKLSILLLLTILSNQIFAEELKVILFPLKNYKSQEELSFEKIVQDIELDSIQIIPISEYEKVKNEMYPNSEIGLNPVEMTEISKKLKLDYVLYGEFASSEGETILNIAIFSFDKELNTKYVSVKNSPDQLANFFESLKQNYKNNINLSKEITTNFLKDGEKTAEEWYDKGLSVLESNNSLALEYFQKAIEKNPTNTDALKFAGYVSSSLHKYDLAFEYLYKAEKILREENKVSTAAYADLIMIIGGTYYTKREYDKAMVYYSKSKSIYDDLGMNESSGYANLVYGIGNIYSLQGKNKEALEMYMITSNIFKKSEQTGTVMNGHLLYAMGYLNTNLQKYDDSIQNYLEAEKVYDSLNMKNTEVYGNLMYNIGYIYEIKKEPENYKKYYKLAKLAFDRAGVQNNLSRYAEQKSQE